MTPPAAPKVTFLVPAYVPHVGGLGALRLLGECLDSVEAQTCPEWEVVLVHDGPNDAVHRLYVEFSGRTKRVTYFEAPYRGIRGGHHAVEAGKHLAHAQSEFLCILNGDNLVMPEYVERMYDEDADISTCWVEMRDIPGTILNGRAFQRGAIDRLNYAIRTDVARRVRHKMHLDADYDYLMGCYEYIVRHRPVRINHVDAVLGVHR